MVLSGGCDDKVVLYDFIKGNVLKIMDMGIEIVSCLFKMGEVACVGGTKTVKFVDVNNLKQIKTKRQIKTDCEYVYCMNFKAIKTQNNDNTLTSAVLFLGGENSQNMTKSVIPQEITQKYEVNDNGVYPSKDQQIEHLKKENASLKNQLQDYDQIKQRLNQLESNFDQKLKDFAIKENQYKTQIQQATEASKNRLKKLNQIVKNFNSFKKVLIIN